MVPNFVIQYECEACVLSSQAKYVGMPTKPAPDLCSGHDRALLVIGQAPGWSENEAGEIWVGWGAGLLCRILKESFHFDDHVDVYLSNICRCWLPQGVNLGKKMSKACAPHLEDDLRLLLETYGEGNVMVLALGAKASSALVGKSLKKAFPYQGQKFTFDNMNLPSPIQTFFSYHPAGFAPGRHPELIHPFTAHMEVMLEYITGKRKSLAVDVTPFRANTLGYPPTTWFSPTGPVALDIETYGMLEGVEQTVFNPAKSVAVDGRTKEDMILSCALAWWSEGIDEPVTVYYNMQNPHEVSALASVLRELPVNTYLLGQNVPFDISYLTYCYPQLAKVLKPEHLRLMDTSILNHLHADLRPERSLKAMAHLFNIANYHEMSVSTLPSGQSVTTPEDPGLMYYNCTDAIATLKLAKKFNEEMSTREYPPHPGFDQELFRSNLLWLTVHMNLAGMAFSISQLKQLEVKAEKDILTLKTYAAERGYVFGGKGSEKPQRRLITEALEEANLLDDDRVEVTKVGKKISFGKNNVQLLMRLMPLGTDLRTLVEKFHEYMVANKLLTAYVGKLLNKPASGICEMVKSTLAICVGKAYPSWFPTPAYVKDDSGKEGGTRQGRFAAANPPAQTFPAIVKKTLTSRYPHGVLMSYDLSQIELRMAALLSGDENMIAEYSAPNPDLHWSTALAVFPDATRDDSDADKKRNLGKDINFLTLYRGGAYMLVELCRTSRRGVGIELSLDFAEQAIERFWVHRQGLREWQDRDLIAHVIKHGCLVLPTGWRRTFTRGAHAVESTFINEICNFPIQTLSAQVMQSAQIEILRRLRQTNLTYRMPAQIHDDVLLDAPRSDAKRVHDVACDVLAAPPLWTLLCEWNNRYVPIDFEGKIL